MAEEANSNSMNVRFLVNVNTHQILYAEAGKDFVDLLLSFLLLPTGTVIKLLSGSNVSNRLGSITNLYDSVNRLQSVFMNGDKSDLLQPKIAVGSPSNMLRIESAPVSYYVCSYLYSFGSNQEHCLSFQTGQNCICGNRTETEIKIADPARGVATSGTSGGGYVKETVTFMITDDLNIMPSSTITSICLLNKLNLKDLTELEERSLTVGLEEALRLLRAALISTTALNDVFRDRLYAE